MKKILLVCLFTQGVLHAQLDRVRINMTESEFIKAFPEAHRDYESEAYWVTDFDTIEGATGNSLWRVLNDTIREYSFRSLKVDGPSYRYTTVDSSRVHNLRMSAMKLEGDLEKMLGKPTTFRYKGLLERPRQIEGSRSPGMETAEQNEILFAQWIFDDGKVIMLNVSTDLSPGNRINAPVSVQTQKSESYELDITITRPLPAFGVGYSTTRFESLHPGILGEPVTDHFYRFTDTLSAPDGQWTFRFRDQKISQMDFTAYNGTAYGDRIDAISYSIDKYRAEKLLQEGISSFGQPDSISNRITQKYEPSDLSIVYRKIYLDVNWVTANGPVHLLFEEWGGGKKPGVAFSIQIKY